MKYIKIFEEFDNDLDDIEGFSSTPDSLPGMLYYTNFTVYDALVDQKPTIVVGDVVLAQFDKGLTHLYRVTDLRQLDLSFKVVKKSTYDMYNRTGMLVESHIEMYEEFDNNLDDIDGLADIKPTHGEGIIIHRSDINREVFNELPSEDHDSLSAGDVVIAHYFGGVTFAEFELIQQDLDDTEPLGNHDTEEFFGLEGSDKVVKKSSYDRAMRNTGMLARLNN